MYLETHVPPVRIPQKLVEVAQPGFERVRLTFHAQDESNRCVNGRDYTQGP